MARLRFGSAMAAIGVAGCAVAFWSVSAMAQDRLSFTVSGGEDGLEDDLRGASLLVAAQDEGVADAQEILAAARADYGRLIGALYAEGHYGGYISIQVNGREAADVPPLDAPERIGRIQVFVQPGPAYTFSQARIAPLAPGTELPEGFARGETARSGVIEDAAGAAVEGWRDVGHAKADIAGQQVVARHERAAIATDIGIAPGPLVRFGDLILRGGQSVRPERLRAIAGLPAGAVFSPEELQNVADRLRRTEVFSSVALTEAERLGPGNTMDITATLAEQPPRRFGFGAEISTVEGATLSAFWLHRNLLGGAESFRVEGEVSGLGGGTGGLDYSFATRFGRPATLNPETDLFLLAQIERRDEPDYVSTSASIGGGLTRRFSDRLSASAGVALRFSQDQNEVRGGGTISRDYLLLTFPLEATYDSREDPLNAKDGVYATSTLTPFAGLNDDAGSGARLTFDTRSYYSFGGEQRLTLAGRLQGGSILGADLTGVPNDYRFYSGGGGTVRGQSYQSLGVTLPGGIESGGASFLAASAEIRGEVTKSIGLVAFYDYGIVGEDSFPGGDSDNHAGAGLGLRYLTPIGPIRLDVAQPIGGTSSGVEVYIGIGQAF